MEHLPIRCAHLRVVDPVELKPHPLNPNVHPPKQIELFIEILKYQGWRRPITVSKRSGFVTKGHGALESALAGKLGWVPVDEQDYDSEEQELADIAADNMLQRLAIMEAVKLNPILVRLNSGAFNMELTGIPTADLKPFLAVGQAPAPQFSVPGGSPQTSSDFDTTGSVDANGVPMSPPTSHVRMVQLFFNEETQAEFLQIMSHFQQKLGLDNLTDTTLEVVRRAYQSDCESKPATPAQETTT